jgi:hypothetical protein
MEDAVVMREERVLKRYAFASAQTGSTIVNPAVASNSTLNGGRASIDIRKNCENWSGEDELDVLHRYFARHVYRDGLTFREWCVPQALATIVRSHFRSVPKCPGMAVDRVFKTLKAKRIIGD